ncbi:MAG: twin-arginine translocation signal domain-containing protein, partial [bacterium]
MKSGNNQTENRGLSRREFFKTTALLGGSGVLTQALSSCSKATEAYAAAGEYPLENAENII